MKPLRWAFFHFRLWAFELRLWMDGLPWEEARFLAGKCFKELDGAASLPTRTNPES